MKERRGSTLTEVSIQKKLGGQVEELVCGGRGWIWLEHVCFVVLEGRPDIRLEDYNAGLSACQRAGSNPCRSDCSIG